ncbi:hypothetical protein OSB04_002444 [Centaurea solstitialis]|uniref:TIR domain-containing protein n=1 Tax=Centaurea solstitialis TaxID=347529 RepID=A0AA38U0I5_9ASTR|nr:hypothetical protein OSB04_002444 [Centaurea solstitialis]
MESPTWDQHFLGISASRSSTGLFLSQQQYATQILERAKMLNCNPARTPTESAQKLGADGPPVTDPTLYRSLVGALQYLTFTRPEIAFAVQQICLYMHDPREPHFHALKRILRYIRGTLTHGLQIHVSPSSDLIAYTDADWGGCPASRRSTSGYCVFLGDNLVSWSSKRQGVISRSSAEAEYRGVANAVAETSWIRNLLRELHRPPTKATIVYCDNVSAVYMSSNPVQHQRTKHIEMDIHFVRDKVAIGHFERSKSGCSNCGGMLIMDGTSASDQRQCWTYDVFVSFRGEDIRKSFLDHLFKEFRQKGIHAFRDDNQLSRGEEISSQLYKAIAESRFLIVIFSKDYASSSWCLRELVKIIECKQMADHKHEIRIIFYDVKPNVVRKQTESYAEAFLKHELSNRIEVAKWKEALTMASNLSGWDLQGQANGISKEILAELCNGPLHIGENLVALDSRIKKMDLLRFLFSNKVHMIGICGIGGIGKITFAKAIYNLMDSHFEECSFLDDVQGETKRHGLTHVVMQLINNIMKTTDVTIPNIGQAIMVMKQRMAGRRILLVLDDVDHHDQLEALAVGSKIYK